jgi:hypothetical protein
MSRHRQAQWTHRLQQLQALRERLTAAGRNDRAYKAHLIAQHGYARWAHEVFAASPELCGILGDGGGQAAR